MYIKLACPECGKERFTHEDDGFKCVSCGTTLFPEEMSAHVYDDFPVDGGKPFIKVMDFTREPGERFQKWEGEHYYLYIVFFDSGFASIHMKRKDSHSRFLPVCYVASDEDDLPSEVTIQTTSYGAISISEIEELNEALRCAVETAKTVNAQFVEPIRNGTFNKGELIPREDANQQQLVSKK